jgi:hypothetical protein
MCLAKEFNWGMGDGRRKWCEVKMVVQVTLLMQAFSVPPARFVPELPEEVRR